MQCKKNIYTIPIKTWYIFDIKLTYLEAWLIIDVKLTSRCPLRKLILEMCVTIADPCALWTSSLIIPDSTSLIQITSASKLLWNLYIQNAYIVIAGVVLILCRCCCHYYCDLMLQMKENSSPFMCLSVLRFWLSQQCYCAFWGNRLIWINSK